MTIDENGYGVFGDMHLEEILRFLLGEGFWMRLHLTVKGQKTSWVVRVKNARIEGITKSEYRKIPDVCVYVHPDLMRAAREAACVAFYGEPEIDLGVKDEE